MQLTVRAIRDVNASPGRYVERCTVNGAEIIVVNYQMQMQIGSTYVVFGDIVHHPKHGEQFDAKSCILLYAKNIKETEIYITEKFNVPLKIAKLITEKFGDRTFDVIRNSPEEMFSVPYLGSSRAARIVEICKKENDMLKTKIKLQELGFKEWMIDKAVTLYGEESIRILMNNPYILVRDIGADFKVIDEIANGLNIKKYDSRRIDAAIWRVIDDKLEYGDTYIRSGQLKDRAREFLGGMDSKCIYKHIDSLSDSGLLVSFETAEGELGYRMSSIIVSPEVIHEKEQYIADRICEMSKMSSDTKVSYKYIKEKYPTLDDTQISAVNGAVNSRISIISGGPGTGKTTITKAIIELFEEQGNEVLLATPTGKASKRMEQVTGREAKTIHRLLEATSSEFGKNENNQVNGDVLILDECSMIDVSLMYQILKATPKEMRLILIGDENQLPSIDCGNVFSDIKNSKVCPTYNLTKTYRQGEGSSILMVAKYVKDLRDGDIFPNIRGGDFFGCKAESPGEIVNRIVEIIKRLGTDNVQVVSPQRETQIGTNILNKKIQEAINQNDVSCSYKGKEFRIGDKVIHTKNNYEKNVFNGDMGVVSGYDIDSDSLIVDFGDFTISYENRELEDLELAYAITIHKSQGSEFDTVIIPLWTKSKMSREALYTGITRASKKLIMVGDEQKLKDIIKRDEGGRDTMLCWMIEKNMDCDK